MANIDEELSKLVRHAETAVSNMCDFERESEITSGFSHMICGSTRFMNVLNLWMVGVCPHVLHHLDAGSGIVCSSNVFSRSHENLTKTLDFRSSVKTVHTARQLHVYKSRQVFIIGTVAAYSAKYSALVPYKILELFQY